MKAFFALLVATLLSGRCASRSAAPRPPAHTMAEIGALPKGEIASGLSRAQWREISSWEYDAYLVIDATVNSDGRMHVTKFRESFPDASWNGAADVVLNEVRIRPTLVGSHMAPRAEIYIVFFKSVKDGRLALVYARENHSGVYRIEIQPDEARGAHQSQASREPGTSRYFNILALAPVKDAPGQPAPAPAALTPPKVQEARRQ